MGILQDQKQEADGKRRRGALLVDLERLLGHTDRALCGEDGDRPMVYEVRYKAQDTGMMAVLKARTGDGSPVVAFCGGGSYPEVVANVEKGLATDGLRWRPDLPFKTRNS